MNAITIVKKAIKYNVEIMGDDFIGYKFVGEDSDFWNNLLLQICDFEEIRGIMNSESLKKNNISFSDYDSNKW
jgi:hypothetical protein